MPRRSRRWRAHQFVAEPESASRIAPSGRRGDSSWKTSCGFTGSAGACARSASVFHQLSTPDSISSRHAAVGLRLEQGQERAEGRGGIALEVDLVGVPHAQPARVDVDLHGPRAARLGQPLGVREARADHEQRVAAVHHVGARLRAQQADRAGHPRQVVGHRGAAVQRLGDAGAERVGDRDDLVERATGARAHEHRHALARVEDVGGAAQVLVAGHDHGRGPADRGGDRAVLARRLLVGQLLDVGGDDDRRHRPLRQRRAQRAVDQVTGLARVDALAEVLARRRP